MGVCIKPEIRANDDGNNNMYSTTVLQMLFDYFDYVLYNNDKYYNII